MRDGKWKLVTKSIPKKPKNPLKDKVTWELYDMSADVTEKQDLAKQKPEAVQRLSQLWQNLVCRVIRILALTSHQNRQYR